jgi:hypothetical protein
MKDPVSPGKYSEQNSYKEISAMKHDIFKQLTLDLFPVILLGFATQKEIFNCEKPFDTILGKSLLSGFGYLAYYQLIQPYIINNAPNF